MKKLLIGLLALMVALMMLLSSCGMILDMIMPEETESEEKTETPENNIGAEDVTDDTVKNNDTSDDDENVESIEESADIAEEEEEDSIETTQEGVLGFGPQDYGNRDFKILLNNVYPIFERDFYVEEVSSGNNLSKVVHSRNVECEKYLGIKLVYIREAGDWKSGISTKVGNLVLSDACDYDMMAVAVNAGLNGGNIGIYQNIMEMEYIDFDHSWWIQDMIDQNSINDQLYFLAGDTCMTTYSSMGCVFVNLAVAEEYGIDYDFYEMVREGEWTVEKLFENFKKVKGDSNGDGTIDPLSETYGWCDHGVGTRLMWSSCGIDLLERKNDGTFALREELDDHILSFVEKMKDACDSPLSYHTEKDAEMADAFASDRVLFATTQLARIEDIKSRNMESAFAILPLPKYDTDQSDYISTAMANHNALFFPISISSPELSAQVAEFMGWYGQTEVIPEYYDVNLKYKQNDDRANMEMLDLIRDKLRVTPNETYGAVAGGESVMTMTQTTATNTSTNGFYSNPTSVWETSVSKLSGDIQAYIYKYFQ